MPPPLPDRVRASCAAVVARARWVRLDDDGLRACARDLDPEALRPPSPGGADVVRDEATTAGLALLGTATAFGSGWFDDLRKRPALSGARTLLACLRERVERHGLWPAEELGRLGVADVAALFEQDGNDAVADLVGHLHAALVAFGRWVEEEHERSYVHVVESAGGSAVALAETLAAVPAWRDVGRHPEAGEVQLWKRAQLAPAELARALGGAGLGRFDDLDRLTMFADNLVPHVLRVDGALTYDPALLERIQARRPLEAGSAEELEIRAAGVVAVERIVALLHEAGAADVTAAAVDAALWWRGQHPTYKAVPRHRARTTAY